MAETTGLKPKQVKDTLEAMVDLAAKQLKSVGALKFEAEEKACISSKERC